MIFCHKNQYGKDLYYPGDEEALKFIQAFPGSSGKRKSLTKDQLETMRDSNLPFIIKDFFTTNTGGGANAYSGNDRL